jgi:hypothetical protein
MGSRSCRLPQNRSAEQQNGQRRGVFGNHCAAPDGCHNLAPRFPDCRRIPISPTTEWPPVRVHLNPPLTFVNYPHRMPSSDLSTLSPTSFTSPPNPATNKSRIAHAKPIAPPRPPRQRLRTNPPIASAPAGNTWVLAEAHRRCTCR